MIERLPCGTIKPPWTTRPADRYLSHPHLNIAIIQTLFDPEFVYVVTEQVLPISVLDAVSMVVQWRTEHFGAPDEGKDAAA
jgi:hypothetical protein